MGNMSSSLPLEMALGGPGECRRPVALLNRRWYIRVLGRSHGMAGAWLMSKVLAVPHQSGAPGLTARVEKFSPLREFLLRPLEKILHNFLPMGNRSYSAPAALELETYGKAM